MFPNSTFSHSKQVAAPWFSEYINVLEEAERMGVEDKAHRARSEFTRHDDALTLALRTEFPLNLTLRIYHRRTTDRAASSGYFLQYSIQRRCSCGLEVVQPVVILDQ